MIYKYYTSGEETSKEGVTLASSVYTDEGVFVAGIEDIENNLYHAQEVTEEVYNQYIERMADPEQRGMYGVVNEVGRAAYLAWLEENSTTTTEDPPTMLTPEQKALAASFFDKLVEGGFIQESDKLNLAIALNCHNNVLTALENSQSGTP